MADRFQVVKVFNSEMEAEVSRSLLEAAGIEAFVFKDDAGGMRPHLQLSEGVRLLVPSEEAEVAREILEKESPNPVSSQSSTETWRCTGCGEILEVQFSECWQCGTSRTKG